MNAEYKWSDLASGDVQRSLAAASHLLPFWISLVFVALIAWALAGLVWKLVPGSAAGDTFTLPATQYVESANGTGADVQAIAGASLFGKADPEAAAEPVPEEIREDLPESTINLTLKGTMASDEEKQSAAIISIGANDEQVFLIGQSVTSGATLHAVYTDRIVLNENGRLTALYLPQEYERPRRTAASRVTRAAPTRAAPSPQSIQSVVSQNVARLSDVIRPTPYFVDGQQQGYRVYPGRDRRQFAALGLRAGDLIRDIDGQALTDPTEAMKIFQSLGSADQVSVTVERDGQPETIILSTDQLDIGDGEEGNDE